MAANSAIDATTQLENIDDDTDGQVHAIQGTSGSYQSPGIPIESTKAQAGNQGGE